MHPVASPLPHQLGSFPFFPLPLPSAVNTLSIEWTELGQHHSCLGQLCKVYGFGARKMRVFSNCIWLGHSPIWLQFYCCAHLLNIILVISINQPASPHSTHKCVYDFQYFLLAPAYVILQAESANSTPGSVFMTVPIGDYFVMYSGLIYFSLNTQPLGLIFSLVLFFSH
jgi:hypothetical protein